MLVQVSSANISMLLPSTTIIIFFFFNFIKLNCHIYQDCVFGYVCLSWRTIFYCDFVVISDIKLKC